MRTDKASAEDHRTILIWQVGSALKSLVNIKNRSRQNNYIVYTVAIGIAPPNFSTDGVTITMELSVPDEIIGSIIGRGGHIIKDIKSSSGAMVKVRLS